jgi:hypothetical protein
LLEDLAEKSADLRIKTDNAEYVLPTGQMDLDGICSQFGTGVSPKDISFDISISKPKQDIVDMIRNSSEAGGYTIVAAPVQFEITGSYQGKEITVDKFNGYVDRYIAIPDGMDPDQVTSAVVLQNDGTLRSVPMKIVKINGKSYAKIKAKRAFKTAAKTAACLCVLLTVASAVLLSVGATRTAILNAVIEWTDKYTAFEFQDTSDQPWRRPTYVPAGYVEKKADFKSAMAQLVYENSAGDVILLNEMKADGTSMAIDNEHHKYSEIQLNGVKAYLFTGETQDYGNILMWETRGIIFTVQTKLDTNELLRIAESIG